jgi:hypothetical protein
MKTSWGFAPLILATALSLSQENSIVGDFTKSPTEHIIQQIDQPFEVKSISGTVLEKGGFHEPMAGVLFEIQGPDSDRKIRRAQTDKTGRFSLSRVPNGTYRFKATRNGFQSVMGTIHVSKKAGKRREIKIEMPIGV